MTFTGSFRFFFGGREGFMARKKGWNINEEKPRGRSSYRGVTLIEQQTWTCVCECVWVREDRHYSAKPLLKGDGDSRTHLGFLSICFLMLWCAVTVFSANLYSTILASIGRVWRYNHQRLSSPCDLEREGLCWLARVLTCDPIRRIPMVCRWWAATVMSMEAVWVIRRALCASWARTVSFISVTVTTTTALTGGYTGWRQ